jgi:hypothetical protein
MEMLASVDLALTMVAWPVHPRLSLLHLTLLLWLILMMMKVKRVENKIKMTSEASRRHPRHIFGD